MLHSVPDRPIDSQEINSDKLRFEGHPVVSIMSTVSGKEKNSSSSRVGRYQHGRCRDHDKCGLETRMDSELRTLSSSLLLQSPQANSQLIGADI